MRRLWLPYPNPNPKPLNPNPTSFTLSAALRSRLRAPAGKSGRPVAGSRAGALAELPALANFAMRPPPPGSASYQPQHGSAGRGRHQRDAAVAVRPARGAQPPPPEAPDVPPVPAEEDMQQRPAASPASGSAGKRKRALTPPRSARIVAPATVGGAGKRRAQAGGEEDAGGTGGQEGGQEPDPTPASIRDLSHLQGFAFTARGTLDRLCPSAAHPRRRQVGYSLGRMTKPFATTRFCLSLSALLLWNVCSPAPKMLPLAGFQG